MGSRVGAWASPQSSVIQDRSELDHHVETIRDKFSLKTDGDGNDENTHIPVPSFWGGLRIVPYRVEFWSGRNNRLHDRLLMTKVQDTDVSDAKATWKIDRLAP